MAVASRPSLSPMAASTQDEPPPAARRRSASGSFHGRVKPLSCHSRIAAAYRRSGSGSILTAEAYSSCPSPACDVTYPDVLIEAGCGSLLSGLDARLAMLRACRFCKPCRVQCTNGARCRIGAGRPLGNCACRMSAYRPLLWVLADGRIAEDETTWPRGG